MDEVCKTQDVVVHYWNKNLVILIPKVNFSLVGLKPSDVNEHKLYQEVWDKDLEIFKILQKDKRRS